MSGKDKKDSSGNPNHSTNSFAELCRLLESYHRNGRLVFSDYTEQDTDLPPDDPDTIAVAMD